MSSIIDSERTGRLPVRRGMQTPAPKPAYGKKVGRNGPCPCESGKKFKKRYGRNEYKRYYGP